MPRNKYDLPEESFTTDGLSMYEIDPRLKVRTILAPEINVKRRNLPQIKSPKDVYELLRDEYSTSDREIFVVLLLNNKHRVVGYQEVAIGSANSVEIHPREVFKAACIANATAIIVAHVHPAGDPEPSVEDKGITERLLEAGKTLGILVLDHVIIGEDSFASFSDMGLIAGLGD